jgi:hypothetical protein
MGSMVRPQEFGHLMTFQGSCALGAAFEAVGLLNVMHRPSDPHPEMPESWELEKPTRCPACNRTTDDEMVFLITHLNDHHRWTREQIADWIETNIEAKQPAEVTR